MFHVGTPAIDRVNWYSDNYTYVDKNVPSNGSGKLTSIEIYANEEMSGVKVAVFYVVSGNFLTARDSVIIGIVPVGHNQFDVDLDVNSGDHIGIFWSGGKLERDNTGASGTWYRSGDQTSCVNLVFSHVADRAISLYGTGELPPPPPSDSARTGIYSFKTLK